jgi:phosphoribosylcarboxyaminoimidazole (NCAIR) mutase
MPAGIPVATMAIGQAGAANAAILAAEILALGDNGLAEKLRHYRSQLAEQVSKDDGNVSTSHGA